jgi:hypothetical protein
VAVIAGLGAVFVALPSPRAQAIAKAHLATAMPLVSLEPLAADVATSPEPTMSDSPGQELRAVESLVASVAIALKAGPVEEPRPQPAVSTATATSIAMPPLASSRPYSIEAWRPMLATDLASPPPDASSGSNYLAVPTRLRPHIWSKGQHLLVAEDGPRAASANSR